MRPCTIWDQSWYSSCFGSLTSDLPFQEWMPCLHSHDSCLFHGRIGTACRCSWIDLNKKYKKVRCEDYLFWEKMEFWKGIWSLCLWGWILDIRIYVYSSARKGTGSKLEGCLLRSITKSQALHDFLAWLLIHLLTKVFEDLVTQNFLIYCIMMLWLHSFDKNMPHQGLLPSTNLFLSKKLVIQILPCFFKILSSPSFSFNSKIFQQ